MAIEVLFRQQNQPEYAPSRTFRANTLIEAVGLLLKAAGRGKEVAVAEEDFVDGVDVDCVFNQKSFDCRKKLSDHFSFVTRSRAVRLKIVNTNKCVSFFAQILIFK